MPTPPNPTDNITVNAGTGLLHGLLGAIGLGSVYDSYGELQQAANDAQKNINTNMNLLTIEAFKSQSELNNKTWEYLRTNQGLINKTIKYYDTVTKINFYEQNIFIKSLSVFIIIIIFFMLIK